MPDLRGPVIGVDGGATKTDAVVLDADGSVLGSGRAGGSNWERLGLERAVGEIALAIEGALGDAGVARDEIAASGPLAKPQPASHSLTGRPSGGGPPQTVTTVARGPAACSTWASESTASSKCVETMICARGATAAILGARVGSRVVTVRVPEFDA